MSGKWCRKRGLLELKDQLFGNPAFGDSLTTVDARVGLARGNWAVYLFGNNLFDEDGIIQPDATFIANSGTRYQPRTVGINLKFDY